ncbi:hypothetical protein HT031_006172 [Scenedesmus sp. PABB004]|nr:hypothetical protein HT031_006172 [Scenedesmus sp. PABB004]
MKAPALALALLALLGAVAGQGFPSVQDAVASLPELSMLNQNTASIPLADKLRDAGFVGTVFAPTDAALQPLADAVGGDLTSALGDPAQVNDVFSTSVIPGAALRLADLKDGQTLTTLNGNTVTVKVVNAAGGPAYFINSARIAAGNIAAGKAVIHEMSSLVVPPEYQDMLDTLAPASGAAAPTLDRAGDALPAATPAAAPAPAAATPSTPANTAATPADTAALASGSSSGSSGGGSSVAVEEPTARVLAATGNSAGGAAVGAALLAVPALLAVLL